MTMAIEPDEDLLLEAEEQAVREQEAWEDETEGVWLEAKGEA